MLVLYSTVASFIPSHQSPIKIRQVQSKQKSSDQELIQSCPTSDPQNQKGKKDTYTHKNWQTFTKDKHSKPNEQLFSKQAVIQLFYSILFYPITLEGRRGTTDELATIPFHLVLFSAELP